ncbi:methyl-accepting chemotaxis protein [Sphingomonas sp. RT2P30]
MRNKHNILRICHAVTFIVPILKFIRNKFLPIYWNYVRKLIYFGIIYMSWFSTVAPIRMKLLVSFALMTSISTLVAVVGAIGSGGRWYVVVTGIGGIVVSAVIGSVLRNAIADPYVATVVRMEGLAAGDLTSPIAFTNYVDCVGRMTKAMFTFKDTAAAQRAANAEAEAHAAAVLLMSHNMASLADGDLTGDITAALPETLETLKASFNGALANLRALIGGVADSAGSIRTGSDEIAQASEDLARRTEGNAASLEETSAALVQIDTRLKATAVSSAQTVARADQAIATVGGGRATADEAVQAMGRVSDSAKGIDSVIEGLDKIAFQTRVLAMNAAVEAGRAGDAGRGFAVVADLVSALAMRAEEEAKRARDQLTLTQTDIVTAVQAVQKVDGALADISGDVDEVHKLLGTIADDANAQSSAITQISAAIGAMDQSTQQNAAMVEQTSAAARNLTAEVSSLSERAAMFKVEGAKARRAAEPSTAQSLPAQRRPGKRSTQGYRSPIKVLPAATHQTAGGGHDDWNAF